MPNGSPGVDLAEPHWSTGESVRSWWRWGHPGVFDRTMIRQLIGTCCQQLCSIPGMPWMWPVIPWTKVSRRDVDWTWVIGMEVWWT